VVPVPDIDRIHAAQTRAARESGPLTSEQRRRGIEAIERIVFKRRDEIRAACWTDLRKPREEVDLSEIYAVAGEARHARRHLRKWMKPRRVWGRLALAPTSSYIAYEPKGAVLIISPWNFPLNLTFGPLVSAIAAGNRVMIKPSEMTPSVSALMKEMVEEIFQESEVAIIEGDAQTARALLAKRFDHIFFTGSPAVGREVMKAAAEHLASVTLELGGKSPAIIDRSANLDDAAARVAWGKVLNSGQTCIAPDYLLVDESVAKPFVEKLTRQLQQMSVETTGALVNECSGCSTARSRPARPRSTRGRRSSAARH
jgi:aldehyde dehydrogenase (NAD+)